jgi:DNA-binding NarL/FixJ family response regulator
MSISILLADDHKIIRDGLRSLLEKQPDMHVLAEAENGRDAVRLAHQVKPGVIVMDVSMPELNGMEAAQQLSAELPQCKIIALSMHSDKRFVAGMLKAGASAYLLKNSAFDELVDAIKTVLRGETFLSPQIATVVIKDYVAKVSPESVSDAEILSSRERQVLQLLAEGKSTKQIAGELFVSIKTIESHRKNIMQKLNIHNLADLIKFAIREGLTSLEH